MDFHFATAWELISDAIPNEVALICGKSERTWAQYDQRAARIATVLSQHGLGPDSKVGIYVHNSNEYLESQYGIFKIRGCPVNVNYRYKADELIYLLDNADAEAVIYQACYAARIWEIRRELPKVKCFIQIDDGTENLRIENALDYEQAITSAEPMARIERRRDDVYMLYTGGTTGMPKGVMYYNGDFCERFCMGYMARGLGAPEKVTDLPDLVKRIRELGEAPVSLAACPLMHGTGMWLGAMMPLLMGGTAVTISKLGLDPDLLWEEVEEHEITDIAIVGDAFARPMLGALDAAAKAGRPYDISSMQRIISSGVMWSTEVKEGLLKYNENMILHDAMGSTEGGMGSSVTTRETTSETAKFQLSPGVKVFDDNDVEVQPGSGEIGRLATPGAVPIGYYKDPVKSAETFREIDGVRYSFPGDYATVEADGTITLLGRGSYCINTAGEKVFPEEVEEALKKHPGVHDALVVGLPDERFGEKVTAVASLEEGVQDLDEAELVEFARQHLAGYKLPKHVLFVDEVRRAVNGKADYKWARATAESELA
jgi:acyl-CoA synthetase (AMP-forming)/AMP-acid ligase II